MSPATPRPAASLVLIRDGEAGLEVLLGWRHAASRAFPGALVFPGGKIEPRDAAAEAAGPIPPPPGPHPPGAAFAALRETHEETGLWLGADGLGAKTPPADPGFARLTPYAHWVTPETMPYRFDTWFFLAAASAAEARAPLAGDEFERLGWFAPDEVLTRDGAVLFPPTRHTLKRLRPASTVAEALAEAASGGVFEARGPDAI